VNGPAELVAALLADEQAVRRLAAGQELITDDDNRMAVDSNVLALGLGIPALTSITADVDPLLNKDSWLRRALSDADLAFVTWRLLYDRQTPRARLLLETIDDEATRQLLRAMVARNEGRYTEATSLLGSITPRDAVYEQAVFLRVVDRLPEIAQGELNLEQLGLTDFAQTRFGAVLQGWRALGAQDWPRLFELERLLRLTRASDLWAPQASRLRAEWRLRADDPDGAFGREALALIDTAVVSNPTLETYAIRARIGQKLGDTAVFIESVAFLLREVNTRLWYVNRYGQILSAAERRWITSQMEAFGRDLRAVAGSDDSGRASTVLDQLFELEQLFAAY